MNVNAAGDRGLMYIDDQLAFNFSCASLANLEEMVEFYDVTSEGILLDEIYVYEGEPGLPCVESWTCTGYAECVEPALNVSCNAVIDNNACGTNYTGDYSEFTLSQCSYVPTSSGSSSGGGSGLGGYFVDADGNYAGRYVFQPATSEDAPVAKEGAFLSLTGGEGFDIKTWAQDLWTTIKGWFVQ